MCVAKMFSDTVRYIDDLLTINNATFNAIIGEIYPKELSLKIASEAANRVLYLDILISICGNKYVTEVYDKRDKFCFEIVNFPFMSSNIPANPTYVVYISQLVRISRICDTYDSFCARNKLLTRRLIAQGLLYDKLCAYFKKFARRHTDLFSKYGVSMKRHVLQGICILRHDLCRHVDTGVCAHRGMVSQHDHTIM